MYVSWDTCTLRQWLNGTFLSEAFSSDEQRIIQNAITTKDKSVPNDVPSANDIIDKVFLLPESR